MAATRAGHKDDVWLLSKKPATISPVAVQPKAQAHGVVRTINWVDMLRHRASRPKAKLSVAMSRHSEEKPSGKPHQEPRSEDDSLLRRPISKKSALGSICNRMKRPNKRLMTEELLLAALASMVCRRLAMRPQCSASPPRMAANSKRMTRGGLSVAVMPLINTTAAQRMPPNQG